ncbi:MAG: FtsX-like permease family protein [Thermoanaerobaculia bacterium]
MQFGPILRAMARNKVRFGLIALEIALTLAIVTNCVNMIRVAKADMSQPSGFDDDNILTVRSQPFTSDFREEGYLDNAVRSDMEVMRHTPGVKAVTNSRFLPWQGGGSSSEVRIAGSKTEMLRTQVYGADGGTLDSLRAPIIEGRNFTQAEAESEATRLRELLNAARPMGEDGKPKEKITQDIIISKAFAKLITKDGNALNVRLEDNDGDQYRVVGVIGRFYNPYGWPIHEFVMFFPGLSRSYEGGMQYLLRVEPGRMDSVKAAIEKNLLAANAGRNLTLRPLSEIKTNQLAQPALMVRMLTVVIFLLLFVTCLGIVGLTAFSVAERTRQIGTRRALGALKSDILQYFLLENWIVTSIGLTVGVVLTYALNIALVTKLNGTKLDPGLVVMGVVLLWAAGLTATYFPALRGVRVAPAIATRNV